mmetsp:Transcript_8565/g.35695  ORF Transcript_8565/g.35695 Transcript_8565/m.35695 type:complete len:540 (-) Transcript_8565:22-1641(-)
MLRLAAGMRSMPVPALARHSAGLRRCHSQSPISAEEFDHCMKQSLFAAARALSAPILVPREREGNKALLRSVVRSIQQETSRTSPLNSSEEPLTSQNPLIALAFSGGSDSLALASLTHQWLAEGSASRGVNLLAIHVDHSVRSDSAADAVASLHLAEKMGIETRQISLQWRPGSSPMQEKLRKERYSALQSACGAANIPLLLTGHHLDDEVETAIMRMQRSSTLHGLSGSPVADKLSQNLSVVKPLLSFPKARLLATCQLFGLDWIEDASNRSSKYTRNVVRIGLEEICRSRGENSGEPGLFHEMVSVLGDIGSQLDTHLSSVINRSTEMYWSHGFAVVNVGALLHQPCARHLTHHVLRAVCRAVGSKKAATGGNQFKNLHEVLVRALTLENSGTVALPQAGGLAWTLLKRARASPTLYAHAVVSKRSVGYTTLPIGRWRAWERWRLLVHVLDPSAAVKDGFDLSGGVLVSYIDSNMWTDILRMDGGVFKHRLQDSRLPIFVKRSVPVVLDCRGHVIAIPQLGVHRTRAVRVHSQFCPQ